jgi:hypothetical protein
MAKNDLRVGNYTQATAALWMARAHLNHWLGETRCMQGLSSGERDTAKDNTLLHYIYAQMALDELKRVDGHTIKIARLQMCGDDEIAIGISWSDAHMYTNRLRAQGHSLQQRKLMVSSQCGEFLQYNMRGGMHLPKQPLPPAINNYVSGSWYKTSNYSEAAYPQQVAEAGASCVRRGARPQLMADCAAATCNWLCKGKAWRTALSNTNPHWQCTNSKFETAAEQRPSALDELSGKDFHGHKAYMSLLAKAYSLSEEEAAVCSKYALNNILATAKADLHTAVKTITTSEHEDEPTRVLAMQPLTHDAEYDIKGRWLTSTQAVRYDEATWLAVQLNVPLQLVEQIGLKTIVRRAQNQKRKHVNTPDARKATAISHNDYSWLPGACAPYFVC